MYSFKGYASFILSMANPTSVRVYCNEDTELTADEFGSEIEFEVSEMDAVLSVEVERVFENTPFEAALEVDYDETVASREEVVYDISTLDFVHNAQ